MKTITEFSGVFIRSALKVKQDVLKKRQSAYSKGKTETPVVEAPAVEAAPSGKRSGKEMADAIRNSKILINEEMAKAFAESLKLEGDKLGYVLNALTLIDSKKESDLRRVAVFQLAEGEKVPKEALKVGDQYFSVEYLPPVGGRPKPFKKEFNKRPRDGRRPSQ